ncbi:hypothetical protein [Ottowia thiooxydans]|uniref:hypothetical protein n=1 Tax=Ottowia thiooxydans TaxID=219182 RepID=UPI0012EB671B|nr:hypothetical protein [Ottowia thiooxydans]
MKKVAEDAGYKVVGLRDPRVPFTEWVEAVQAADDAELIRMPAINEDQAAALGALNHMPASLVVRSALGGCRTWSADSENGPQRGQFSRDLQAHSQAMGQKDGEKWTAAAHLQPAISKSDSLLLHPWPILGVMPDSAWLLVLRAREAQLEPVTCR